MHTASLRKVGGSVMLAVPPAVLGILDLQAGAEVSLEVENGRLVIEARRTKRYTLEYLLAQCDSSAPLSEEDQQWTSHPAAGRELI